MALTVAPYNTAMRIGQGFNSYTHEICINDAVVVDGSEPGGDHYAADNNKVSQVATYCTRYVDKLSQVTDAMSVSAALSIKTAAAGGGASGSYIDSDKFKESNINFFVQVKVTNQTIMAEDVTKFQPIPGVTGASDFTKVFGDCYISGFVEGGELDAIISIKTKSQDSDNDIQAALEANFGKGGIGGSIKGEAAIKHAKAFADSETTITVNWCGGGNIKPKDKLWSIESLTEAAAAFPQNVADCPQRVYAILTKYEKLRSFQMLEPRISPLMYENASLYTNDLLDAYMDYRNIWKQIHTYTTAFEFDQVTLERALDQKSQRPKPQGRNPLSLIEDIVSYVEGSGDQSHQEHMNNIRAKLTKPDYRDLEGSSYEPNFGGLEKARKDCRIEMLKILNEVEAVTRDPTLALQQDRDAGYMNPAVFRKLLPVAKEVEKKITKEIKPSPSAASPPVPPKTEFYASDKPLNSEVLKWLKDQKPERTAGYRMTEYAGDHSDHIPPKFIHMFESISFGSVVSRIEVWNKEKHVAALRVTYQHNNPTPQVLGSPPASTASSTFDVAPGERITAVNISAGLNDFGNTKVVYGFTFSTDMLKTQYLGADPKKEAEVEVMKSRALEEGWSLKGFWAQTGDALDRVGLFWGKDEVPQTNGLH